ncbi:MAG: VOC family protein [Caulobacteraceae bacterium]|nr:MAG: VOC family protein [Caulobacteraceae bacterium]
MTLTHAATPVAFVQVIDRARALAFYQDVLGLTLKSSDGFGDFLQFGAGAEIRMTALPGWTPGAHPVVGWNVDDIVAAVQALTAKGVVMKIYEGMGQDAMGVWTSPDGAAKVAFFPDSEGNLLSLAQAG